MQRALKCSDLNPESARIIHEGQRDLWVRLRPFDLKCDPGLSRCADVITTRPLRGSS